MPVTLVDYALVTAEDAATFLNVDVSDLVLDLVNRATDYCEWYTNRPLAAREFANLRFPPQTECLLRVRATPIDIEEAISIEVAGIAQTIWATESDGDPVLKDVIVGADVPGEPSHFWRANGWCAGSSRNPYPIKITYTGGFWSAAILGHLRDAALLVVESLFRSQTKKGSDNVQAFGAGPVTPSVTYRVELIPMRSKQILDSYRIHS